MENSEEKPRLPEINRGFVAPAETIKKKRSMFTLRRTTYDLENFRYEHTAHSDLKEVGKNQCIQHDVAFNALWDLFFKTEKNIKKALLIENVTDTIIWSYDPEYRYSNKRQQPKMDWLRAGGDVFLNKYIYFKWNSQTRIWEPTEVNINRDYFDIFQMKVNLNYEWHRQEWKSRTMAQIKRESPKMPEASAVEKYNAQRLINNVAALKRVV